MCSESIVLRHRARVPSRDGLEVLSLLLLCLSIAACGSSPPGSRAAQILSPRRPAGLSAIIRPQRSEHRSAALRAQNSSDPANDYRFVFFDGTSGAFSTTIFGLNDNGVSVGNYFSDTLHGLVRTNQGTLQTVDVPFSDAIGTDWRAVNNRGTIIGGWADPDFFVHGAVRSPAGAITRFDYPGAAETFPGGINDQGDIVGSHDQGDITGAGFLYRAGRFIDLPDVPQAPQQNYPAGINNSGVIAGNYLDSFDQSRFGFSHGYVLQDSQYTTFDFPGAFYTSVNAINDHGQVVGFYILPDGTEAGFIFDIRSNGFRSFSCPDAQPTDADAINNRGQVGGICITPDGAQGFVATPANAEARQLD